MCHHKHPVEQVNRLILFIAAVVPMLIVLNCSIAPGSRMVGKGTLEIGGEAAMVIGNVSGSGPGFPVVPNAGVSLRYGLSDYINTGGIVYPLYLIANKTIGLEPYFSAKALAQGAKWPSVITYLKLPLFLNFSKWEVFAFPVAGLTFNYVFDAMIPYVGYEISVDPDIEGAYRDVHHTVRSGISWKTARGRWLSVEISCNSIGTAGYITNHHVGYPCVNFGYSFPIGVRNE